MGSPYLNSNEAIVLSTHNVVINTVPAEAILTSQRLILVDARHASLRPQDIPFGSLETVTIGENTAMDPVLSLSIVLPDETRHTLGIVFPQAPRQKRTAERDEWAAKIREMSLVAQKESGVKPAELLPPWVAGELPEEEGVTGEETGTDAGGHVNPPLAPRKPRAKASSGNRRSILAAGIVLILIIALVAAVMFLAPAFTGNLPTTPVTTVPTDAVPSVTPSPAVTEQPTAAVTPEPAGTPENIPVVTATTIPEATQAPAPQLSGVWIRIQYDGEYSASYGTSGRIREVSASGEQYYQIPAKDQIVDAVVQKLDASGDLLTVSIFQDGIQVSGSSTTKPYGTVEIHADLRVS
ncbi:hypothetical protein [Methanoregula sp.]|uniref:hypothetical protein n=1 Tax=Methanoregula sp. TaxID=2052170 RepID=UPI000CADFF43|nr:hypothetical protein [Methanoregula sp.]PKG33579.1 MAG: hypothetical protein CW742_02190 [Methanoregula sp.]